MTRKNPQKGPRKAPQGVVSAADTGDRLELLLALRARLAGVIDDGCSPRDLVGLSRRLLDVAQEIEDLRAGREPVQRLRAVDETFDPSSV